ncbi:MAG: flagellin [Vicinamibacterales bacterium]
MRVTFKQLHGGIDQVNVAASQFTQAQWEVSTGKRLRVPSDDPSGTQRAVLEQSNIDSLDAYSSAAGSASARLTALDTTLGSIGDQISAALTALQSSLGSTATQPVRDAAAATFKGIRDGVASAINSSVDGARLFSGTKSNVASYAQVSGAWTYQGDSQQATVAIDNNRNVGVSVDGQSILKGSDAADVLTTLDNLATAAQNNDQTTLKAGVQLLKNAFDRATRAQSQVGYDESNVAQSTNQIATLRTAAVARLSTAQDTNMAEAITRMAKAQTAYQAALGAVGAASKLSLMDYIR